MTRKQEPSEPTFADRLRELRSDERITQPEAAALFHVSPKTLARWEAEEGIPDLNQRHGVVARVGAVYPRHKAAIAASLGVDVPSAPQNVASHPAIVEAAMHGALFEAASLLGAPVDKVRDAIVLVFERAALCNVDARSAAAVFRAKR